MSIAELKVGVDESYAPHGSMPLTQRTKVSSHLTVAPPPLPRPSLSTREVEVLLAWMSTESKEDAANKLFISQSTVSTHISRIRAKYAAVGRPAPTKTHLLVRALQDGYTTLEAW